MSEALEPATPILPAKALAISTFEQELGGREVLFSVLSQGDITPEIQQLLGWLGDPRYEHHNLATICRAAGLHPGEVFQAFERALQAKAAVLARIPIAENLPKVTADAMRRAMLHKVICPECNGRQKLFVQDKAGYITEKVCQACEEGWVNKEPTLEQQRLALELGELLQKGGVSITNTQQVDNSKTVQLSLNTTLAKLQATAAAATFTVEATEPLDGETI